jgi:sortase A
MAGKGTSTLRLLQWVLLAVGAACASWYGWTTLEIHRHQEEARQAIDRFVIEPPPPPNVEPAPELPPEDTRVIGQIDIPSVRLSAVVVDTDDDDALGFAVGYLPDTPPPWQSGNSAFAAHRDGLFRPLQDVRAGDEISLTTRHGQIQYRVIRTLIVRAKDVWVLGPLPQVDLTLITCFPFTYVGHAPKRFIVQAEKVQP